MLWPPALALRPGARTPGPRGQVCGDLLQAGVPAGQRARCEGCLGVREGGELGRSPLGSEALAVRCEGGDAPGTAGSCLVVRSQAQPPPPCPTGPPARLCAGPHHPPGRPGPPDRAAGTLSMGFQDGGFCCQLALTRRPQNWGFRTARAREGVASVRTSLLLCSSWETSPQPLPSSAAASGAIKGKRLRIARCDAPGASPRTQAPRPGGGAAPKRPPPSTPPAGSRAGQLGQRPGSCAPATGLPCDFGPVPPALTLVTAPALAPHGAGPSGSAVPAGDGPPSTGKALPGGSLASSRSPGALAQAKGARVPRGAGRPETVVAHPAPTGCQELAQPPSPGLALGAIV